MKYGLKKVKVKVESMDVSASTPRVDASILQELRDEIAAAKSVGADAKSGVDFSCTSDVFGICGFGTSGRPAFEQVVEDVANLSTSHRRRRSNSSSADNAGATRNPRRNDECDNECDVERDDECNSVTLEIVVAHANERPGKTTAQKIVCKIDFVISSNEESSQTMLYVASEEKKE
jgi:hypothetical protein